MTQVRAAAWNSILAILLAVTPQPDLAQQGGGPLIGESEPFAEAKRGKILRAYHIREATPVVDGRLDDEVWACAPAIDDLVQWEPDNMAPLSERTVAQVAFDDRYLYIAVQALDGTPGGVTAGIGRRDNFPPTDQVSVGFDPRHDHQTAYIFQTNPSGVQGDMRRFDDTRTDRDYDAVWEVGTQRTAEGWVAEFRVPFSQMHFSLPVGSEAVWGFNVRRTIQRRGESGEWVGRPRGEQGNVSRWGHLIFEADALAPPRRIEVLPYVLAGRTEFAGTDNADHVGGLGADLRVGIGSATTLSASVNPDFAQVEQDPAVLNLSVFETFFPERRPFFLEDARTFISTQQQFQLFHSRRIGRRPGQLAVESDDVVVDRPAETTVLGAAKLTGKSGGWTYGALTAITAREHATIERDGHQLDRLIEPLTSYTVGRLQRDLGGSSNIGGLMTAINRELMEDAFTAGVDHNVRWQENRWRWNGLYAVSRAPGDDGVRTGFGGAGNLDFSGKYVGGSVFYGHTGRHFRVNDIGFLRGRLNQSQIGLAANGGQPDPWGIFRSVRFFGQVFRAWNGDGLP